MEIYGEILLTQLGQLANLSYGVASLMTSAVSLNVTTSFFLCVAMFVITSNRDGLECYESRSGVLPHR